MARIALIFTMASAVLYGLTWLVSLLVDDEPSWLESFGNATLVLTMAGGISMGLVHLAQRIKGSPGQGTR